MNNNPKNDFWVGEFYKLLPSEYGIDEINTSIRKFRKFYFAISRKMTLENYRVYYHEKLGLIHKSKLRLLFMNSILEYLSKSKKTYDTEFITKDIQKTKPLVSKLIFKKHASRSKGKTPKRDLKKTVKSYGKSVSSIYKASGLSSKPIYNQPKY